MKGTGGVAVSLVLGSAGIPNVADMVALPAPPSASSGGTPTLGVTSEASPAASRLVGYAFNAKEQTVTMFDPAARQALATKPLGATVRWLSNEQRFWDGRYIWTYDFPNNRVQAIAVDPRLIRVARTIPTGGAGPAHSLMLTPDRANAWVNVAGDDMLVVLDVASGQVVAQVKTGKFP